MRSQTSSMSFLLFFACNIHKFLLSGFVRLGEKYPEERKTLGDHVRAVRLERGMLQREVADVIGVRRGTINKWECNRGDPRAVDAPAISEFLGDDPFPSSQSLVAQLKRWRLGAGLSARAAARHIGVGEATWAAWERGAMSPAAGFRERFIETFGVGELGGPIWQKRS